MKVEELYSQDKDSQIGITFQREPFETRVDIFPEVSPLQEPGKASMSQQSGEPVETALTSVQMEEVVCRVVKHRGEEEFQPIPLKRVDSGPTSHRLCQQGLEVESVKAEMEGEKSRHQELMDEIDNAGTDETKEEVKKKEKKEGTLTRMREKLKSLRAERLESKDEDGKSTTKSLSKIFHRVNPVGKASRESFSKVFHRIGDVLQRKEEDKEEAKERKDVEKTLTHQNQEQ